MYENQGNGDVFRIRAGHDKLGLELSLEHQQPRELRCTSQTLCSTGRGQRRVGWARSASLDSTVVQTKVNRNCNRREKPMGVPNRYQAGSKPCFYYSRASWQGTVNSSEWWHFGARVRKFATLGGRWWPWRHIFGVHSSRSIRTDATSAESLILLEFCWGTLPPFDMTSALECGPET
jgi:hypothetical protein